MHTLHYIRALHTRTYARTVLLQGSAQPNAYTRTHALTRTRCAEPGLCRPKRTHPRTHSVLHQGSSKRTHTHTQYCTRALHTYTYTHAQTVPNQGSAHLNAHTRTHCTASGLYSASTGALEPRNKRARGAREKKRVQRRRRTGLYAPYCFRILVPPHNLNGVPTAQTPQTPCVQICPLT